jgi:anti-sigma factor RsiW
MSDCRKLDPLVTPYVDGELDARARAEVDDHLRHCPPCHSRVAAEQSVRELLQTKREALKHECAPGSLKARCAGSARLQPSAGFEEARGVARPKPRATIASRLKPRANLLRPFALAASLTVLVGGSFLYQVTERSSRVMAAELVADHVKCFGLNRMLGTQESLAAVEGSLASSFDWRVRLPERPQQIGLELVGARPCLYGNGRVAHIMYRHNGEPVSVFMLPKTQRKDGVLDVMGHECAIWSEGDRTFVLVAREPRVEVARVASFVQASLR